MAVISVKKLGYCKYEFKPTTGTNGQIIIPSNWTNPDDVANGRAVQFSFSYEWDGNDCSITNIAWRPGKVVYDQEANTRSFSNEALESSGFKQNNCITITFGTQHPTMGTENYISGNYSHTPQTTSLSIQNVSQ